MDMSPVSTWSSSGEDDSPKSLLDYDSIPLIPGWPHFRDTTGELLIVGNSEWQQRLDTWQEERTRGTTQPGKRRRHPCRTRRQDRVAYQELMRGRAPQSFNWASGEWNLSSIDNVKLPPPCDDHQALLAVRRVMLRKRELPKGCRVQPSRLTKAEKVERLSSGLRGTFVAAQVPVVQTPPEILLGVSDEEL